MILLLCHLTGDYVLQSHVMATVKTSSMAWAAIHAAFYSIPFAVLLGALGQFRWDGPLNGLVALTVIFGTHALIDRYAIAAKWCRWYGVGHPGVWFALTDYLWRRHFSLYADGARKDPPPERPVFVAPPPFLGVWLQILVDNTMHLAINAAAVYLATGWIG